MADKFELPKRRGNYVGCESLGRMVHVEACRVHSQGLVKEGHASEYVLENCKGCTQWQKVFPITVGRKGRPTLKTPQAKKVLETGVRKKLSL